MKIKRIIDTIEGELIVGEANLDHEIYSAYGSDLMSDVMAFVCKDVLLLTGLINPQVIRTCEMMDISAILFVRGKKPTDEMIGLAKERDITLITTKHSMFISCGRLFSAGLKEKGDIDRE